MIVTVETHMQDEIGSESYRIVSAHGYLSHGGRYLQGISNTPLSYFDTVIM